MKYDSKYFGALNNMITCVENNLESENQDKVCANEFRALRKSAFENQLMYHNMNQRLFMSMISVKKHEAPF